MYPFVGCLMATETIVRKEKFLKRGECTGRCKMRADQDAKVSVSPAEGDDLVMCSAHKSRRLAKFCAHAPICNAERILIGYAYTCKEEASCVPKIAGDSSLNQRRVWDADGSPDRTTTHLATMMGGARTQTLSEKAPTDSAGVHELDAPQQKQQDKPRNVNSRGPNRYYDLAGRQGTSALGTKKVCWCCGMDSHEKSNCPNVLCRVCHTTRGHHHICQEPHSSPFVVLSPALLLSEEMSTVQCVSCFSMGHFDCSSPQTMITTSCCFCARTGHNAYECTRRKEQVPDRWIARVLGSERSLTRRENDRTSTTPSSFSSSMGAGFGYKDYNTTRGYNTAPRHNDRYIHTRERDYARGSHIDTVGNRQTNPYSYNDKESYHKDNRDRVDNFHSEKVEHHPRGRERRTRAGGVEVSHDPYNSRVSSFAYHRGSEKGHPYGEIAEERRMSRPQHLYRHHRHSNRKYRHGSSSDGEYDDMF